MSNTQNQIRNLFKVDDESLSMELIKLAKLYNLTIDDLYFKWESYLMNNDNKDGNELNFKTLKDFKLDLHGVINNDNNNDDFNQTPKKSNVINVKKRLNNNVTPLKSSPLTPTNYQSDSTPLAKPITNFNSRKNAGLVTDTLNSTIPSPKPYNGSQSRVKLMSAFDLQQFKYKYMFEKLTERSAILDERIDYFANKVKEFYNMSEIGDPTEMGQSQRICVGRICKESDNSKLNDESVWLETSKVTGGGKRVLLKFANDCKVRGVPKGSGGIRLFPGRIVGVLGSNGGGKFFGVEEIFTMPPLNMPKTEIRDFSNTPVSVMIACGPYTLDSNLNYEPFNALMNHVEKNRPDVIILMGPFIDSNHPQVKKGEIDELPEEIFRNKIGFRLTRALETVQGCTAVLIPSVRDLISPHVAYPQDSIPRKGLGLPPKQRCKCVTNPIAFHINEVLFGVSNVDNLIHLRKDEYFKSCIEVNDDENNANGNNDEQKVGLRDNMASLCRDIIDQQSFYPLFPVPRELSHDINLDVSHSDLIQFPSGTVNENEDEKVTPDILILPSILKNFAKVVDKTICVNPWPASRGKNAGSFAQLSILPIDKSKYSNNNNNEEENYINHDIRNRCRVDLIQV